MASTRRGGANKIVEQTTLEANPPKDQTSRKRSECSADIEVARQTSIAEGQQGFRGKHDPFANEHAGGVQYKTLVWW